MATQADRPRRGMGRERSVLADMHQPERDRRPARSLRRQRSTGTVTLVHSERAPYRERTTPATPVTSGSDVSARSSNRAAAAPCRELGGRGGSGVALYVQVRVHGVVQRLLVPRMLAQVPVGDRIFLLRRYRRCFTGSDAVAWLMSRRFARDSGEAVALGNALLAAGVFRHVRNEHRFRNGHYFYRFAAHEDYAVHDDHYAGLRSSRLMSVATQRYTRTTAAAAWSSPSVSDGDESMFGSAFDIDAERHTPPFDERHVQVDVGIRVANRMYADLVSRFCTKAAISGVHKRSGKWVKDAFSGGAAAAWLIAQRYVKSEREATAVGNAMIKAGVFFPIDDAIQGFEPDATLYRLTADVDFSAELRRGEMKDTLLRLLGINRSKVEADQTAQNAPWFEDSLSFTTTSDKGS